MDEFEEMDADAGVDAVLAPPQPPAAGVVSHVPANVVELREQLVKKYHGGSDSLVERIAKSRDGGLTADDLLVALIDEVVSETDHLLGNELVAAQDGMLRDASVISYKRAEVLEKAIKAVQAKRVFEKESGIDLDSPSMMVIFRFFMKKANDTLTKMGQPEEMKNIFFSTLGNEMDGWKKELREKFDELRKVG
jgi:hypothetical protein